MLKNVLCGLFLACAVMFGAQAFDWEASGTLLNELMRQSGVSSETLAQAKEFVASAEPTTDLERIRLIRLRALVRFQEPGAARDWSEHKKFIEGEIAGMSFDRAPSSAELLGLLYVWWYRGWDKEVYAFMKTLPGFERWRDAGHVCDWLGLDREAYEYHLAAGVYPDRAMTAALRMGEPRLAFEAAEMVLTRQYDATRVSEVLKMVVASLVNSEAVSDSEMKVFLQKLNRVYSARLIENDAAWRPVITAVRTLLETY